MSFEFAHPTEYISAATLGTLDNPAATALMSETRRVLEDGAELWFAGLDPATAAVLATADDGATDVVDFPVTPDLATERFVAQKSVRAGYWLGRMLLRTAHAPLIWSSDPEPDAARIERVVNAIDIAFLWDFAVGIDLDDDFTRWIAGRVGFPGNEALMNVAALTFDTGLAIAVVEHDLAFAEGQRRPEPHEHSHHEFTCTSAHEQVPWTPFWRRYFGSSPK